MELNMEQERREFEAWLNEGNHCGCNENMWKAWLAAKRSVGGGEPKEGQEISVDVSTGEHDAGHRIFARLTGEFNGDIWYAEMMEDNSPPAPVSAELSEVIAALRHVADDPMWADHAEVRKSTLLAWVDKLDKVQAKAQHREST